MKIVIIEDEELTANYLAKILQKVDSSIQIIAILVSVKSAIEWFNKNKNPDLIFCDIQLGDGLSFEIFKNISCVTPIIFCTAYNEYALNAFKVNGIDYILKPFDKKTIEDALTKFKLLKNNISNNELQYENILKLFENQKAQRKNTLLVYYKDEILPINIPDIALIYKENEITYIITFESKKFSVNKTMDELDKVTDDEFYRVSRQYIVNRKAIEKVFKNIDYQLSLHLKINFKGSIKVRKAKVSEFLDWLSEN